MNRYTSLDEASLQNTWATIGSFDGVHLGHQNIIRWLVREAHAANANAAVLTFYPHPAVVLRGLTGPFLLTDMDERAALLEELGVDNLITLRFDRQMAALTPQEFMHQLNDHLDLRHLLVGYDFALGRARSGDIPTLARIGETLGYSVESMPPVELDGEVVSSSRIRTLLADGDVRGASRLLGRRYALRGEIIHGDGRGHGLGIPTANLDIQPERILPAHGVYATLARMENQVIFSVTNIGLRPTFENGQAVPRVETHLLDFNQDLYGSTMELQFVQYLRPEQRFASVQALLTQIHQDIHQAREVLEHAQTPDLPA